MKKPFLLIILMVLIFAFERQACAAISAAQGATEFDKHFSGTIADRYPIEMWIQREGAKITGSYSYLSNKPQQPKHLALSGDVDGQGVFTLKEEDEEGKQTGTFKGKITYKEGESGAQIFQLTGTWSKSGGGPQSLPFTVTERVLTLNGAAIVYVTRKIEREEKKLKYTVEATYGQFTGSTDSRVTRLNKEIEALVMKKIGEFSKNMKEHAAQTADEKFASEQESSLNLGCRIVTATNGLVSLVFEESTYFAGAAHPNHFSSTLNYDLEAGRPLALSELFTPNSPYLQTISRICVETLKADKVSDPEWIARGAGPSPDNFKSWNITPHGLSINFDPYQVASYAEGPKEVLIPYSALKALLNPQSRVTGFLRA